MKTLFARFAKDESGATAVEYGLIAALIGVAIILGATALGSKLNSTFQYIADQVNVGGGDTTDTGTGTGTGG
jgi:pilus assembly protein Flp/PilA